MTGNPGGYFKEGFKTVVSVWTETLKLIRRHPLITMPFLVVSICEALALTMMFLAPRPPLSAVFGPIIRRLYLFPGMKTGEPYLHYPENFLLLPRLFSHAQIAIGVTVGLLMNAMAVSMVFQIAEKDRYDWWPALRTGFVRYLTLFAVWLVVFGLQFVAGRFLPQLGRSIEARFFLYFVSILLVVILEAFFAYLFPAVVVENQRAGKAIIRSLVLAGSTFLITFSITMVPLLLRIGHMFLMQGNAALINRFFPEITLVLIGVGIVVTLISEIFFRVSATVFFLMRAKAEKEKPGSQPA